MEIEEVFKFKKNFNYLGLLGDENPLLRNSQLLEATINEFSQKKFEEASLNDIIKNANMSKGSLYHHFGDKFGLYLSLMDIVIKKKISFYSQFLEKKIDSGDFFGTLKELVRVTMEFMFNDKRMHHLFNRNLEASDELKNQILKFFSYDYNQGFGDLINSAIQSGQIDNRFTPEFVACILEILFSNSHKLLSSDNTSEELLESIDQLIELMQFGFSKNNRR